MAYRTTYNFRVVICHETIDLLSLTFPCVDFSTTTQLTFKENHTDSETQNTLNNVVTSEIGTYDGVVEFRVCANFVVTYALIDKIEALCKKLPPHLFGLLLIGEDFEDNFRVGELHVGRLLRKIQNPKGWFPTHTFDVDKR